MAVPLGELTLSPRHHRSALWWLGLLYRRPAQFREKLQGLAHPRSLRARASLLVQALPYIILPTVVWQMLQFHYPSAFSLSKASDLIAVNLVIGIALGIAIGIALAMSGGVRSATDMNSAAVVADRLYFENIFRIFLGILFGISCGILFGASSGICFGSAFAIGVLRAYYYVPHIIIMIIYFLLARSEDEDRRRHGIWAPITGYLYRFHPVAWDDLCMLPFPGLNGLLVAYVEIDAQETTREIERLVTAYPSQRMEALKAAAILALRAAGAERDLSTLDARLAALPEGDKGFLRHLRHIREQVGEIANLQRRLDTMSRPAFREPVAAQLVALIDNFHFIRWWTLANELKPAVSAWLAVAEAELEKARTVLAREPTPQVFRAGESVDRATEAFIPRMRAIEELEGQITVATGCPGLLLYGRRRMGKSTLLRNLHDFLPQAVLVGRFSMQNPSAITSLETFVGFVASTAYKALCGGLPAAEPQTLRGLFKALTHLDVLLKASDCRLLLACDEFEAIDEKIGEGVLPLDLLGTLRESVQTHRNLTWVFVGSHHLSELRHADWS